MAVVSDALLLFKAVTRELLGVRRTGIPSTHDPGTCGEIGGGVPKKQQISKVTCTYQFTLTDKWFKLADLGPANDDTRNRIGQQYVVRANKLGNNNRLRPAHQKFTSDILCLSAY